MLQHLSLFFLTRGELKLSSIAVPSFRAERQRSAPLFAALLFSQWLIPTRDKTGRPRINISSSQKREAHPDNTPTAALSLSLSRGASPSPRVTLHLLKMSRCAFGDSLLRIFLSFWQYLGIRTARRAFERNRNLVPDCGSNCCPISAVPKKSQATTGGSDSFYL